MSELIGPRFMKWLNSLSHYTIENVDKHGNLVAYLERYNIAGWRGFKVRIHHILKSDGDRELHSHPWGWFGIILSGGYWEHRLTGRYRRRPGHILFVGRSKLHRVELPAGADSWSLVISTPRLRHSWFFLEGKTLTPWIAFLRKRGIPLGKFDV